MAENVTAPELEAKRDLPAQGDDARKREDVTADAAASQSDINPTPTVGKLPVPPKNIEASAGKPAEQPSDGKKKKREFVSTGERIHNEITYRGVDWGLNSAFSVAFAFFVKRVEWGHNLWEATAGKLSRFAWKPFIKDALKLEHRVNDSKTFLSILIGGTVIIPIMTTLENHKNKKAMVKSIDRMIYGKDKVENDPKFAQSYKEIDQESKKNFWTGMAARFIALAPMYTIMTHPVSGKWFNDNYYPKIATGTKWVSKKIGLQPKSLMRDAVTAQERAIMTEVEFGESKYRNHWDFIHHMIGYDFGMTIFYSILHEIAYKSLAALGLKGSPSQTETPTATQDKLTVSTHGNHPIETPVADKSEPRPVVSRIENLSTVAPIGHTANLGVSA